MPKTKRKRSRPGPEPQACLFCGSTTCLHCQCPGYDKCTHLPGEMCHKNRYGRRRVCNTCERRKLLHVKSSSSGKRKRTGIVARSNTQKKKRDLSLRKNALNSNLTFSLSPFVPQSTAVTEVDSTFISTTSLPITLVGDDVAECDVDEVNKEILQFGNSSLSTNLPRMVCVKVSVNINGGTNLRCFVTPAPLRWCALEMIVRKCFESSRFVHRGGWCLRYCGCDVAQPGCRHVLLDSENSLREAMEIDLKFAQSVDGHRCFHIQLGNSSSLQPLSYNTDRNRSTSSKRSVSKPKEERSNSVCEPILNDFLDFKPVTIASENNAMKVDGAAKSTGMPQLFRGGSLAPCAGSLPLSGTGVLPNFRKSRIVELESQQSEGEDDDGGVKKNANVSNTGKKGNILSGTGMLGLQRNNSLAPFSQKGTLSSWDSSSAKMLGLQRNTSLAAGFHSSGASTNAHYNDSDNNMTSISDLWDYFNGSAITRHHSSSMKRNNNNISGELYDSRSDTVAKRNILEKSLGTAMKLAWPDVHDKKSVRQFDTELPSPELSSKNKKKSVDSAYMDDTVSSQFSETSVPLEIVEDSTGSCTSHHQLLSLSSSRKEESVDTGEKRPKLLRSLSSYEGAWREAIDKRSGRVYYWNTLTRDVAWEMPISLEMKGMEKKRLENNHLKRQHALQSRNVKNIEEEEAEEVAGKRRSNGPISRSISSVKNVKSSTFEIHKASRKSQLMKRAARAFHSVLVEKKRINVERGEKGKAWIDASADKRMCEIETKKNFNVNKSEDRNEKFIVQRKNCKSELWKRARYLIGTSEFFAHGQFYQLEGSLINEILAFPCNQFGWQEQGTLDEIKEFVDSKNVKFKIMSKIRVNGLEAHKIFSFLTAGGRNPVEWNFTKFIINRAATEFRRYNGAPNELEPLIEQFLCANH
eukprot:g2269.t1